MCLCFGFGGVGEWVGGLSQVLCESGFSVLMADPGICILCQADTCAS